MTSWTSGEDDWAEQVTSALAGDERAWTALVDRLSGVVWKVLGNYALEPADRDDAFASTFFRLYEKLHTVKDPRFLPGWTATVARNEVRALWRQRSRLTPVEEVPLKEFIVGDLDESLLDAELLREVLRAFGALPVEGQALLRLLVAVPPLSYEEISSLVGMPRGSIGPTAGRLLEKIRRQLMPRGNGLRT